jgi:hypothetical protein
MFTLRPLTAPRWRLPPGPLQPAPGRSRRARSPLRSSSRAPRVSGQDGEKELEYQLRRRREREVKQKSAATLIGLGMKQKQVAAEVGVTARTLHNWKQAPGFSREVERQRERINRGRARAARSQVRARRARTRDLGLDADLLVRRPELRPQQPPAPAPESETITQQRQRPAADPYHAWLDEHDRRRASSPPPNVPVGAAESAACKAGEPTPGMSGIEQGRRSDALSTPPRRHSAPMRETAHRRSRSREACAGSRSLSRFQQTATRLPFQSRCASWHWPGKP